MQPAQQVLTEWSGVLQWFWDLSEWKLTKVFNNRCFRELESLVSGLDYLEMKKYISKSPKKMVFFIYEQSDLKISKADALTQNLV